ncbi:MAG: hypothetical protein KF778_19810 [Rhodocyclaceae bacterium]|nr:hypothetical protein [Rhodocyclaceae bacterium]MBX3670654.1 hypothetical protein [Rhodocyclaceae bacterium]
MNTRDLRAARARYCYDEAVRWKPEFRKEITQRLKGLPVQMRSQGLANTLALLMADDKFHVAVLAEILARWLLEKSPLRPLPETGGPAHWGAPRRLLDACVKARRIEYAWAQIEAIALMDQLKLFAGALAASED